MNTRTTRAFVGAIAAFAVISAPATAFAQEESPSETATTSASVPAETSPTASESTSSDDVTPPSTPTSSSSTRTSTTTPVNDDEDVDEDEVTIRTSAGEVDGNRLAEGSKIRDVVTYTGLTPGKTYILHATTADKATGKVIEENTGYTEFVPSSSSGRIDVEIRIEKATDEMVVFEQLIDEAELEVVAEHRDINDRSQTLSRNGSGAKPSIRTSASVGTDNVIQSGSEVVDSVIYEGLVPGEKYRLEGRLICTDTGVDTGAKQTAEFTAEKGNATYTMTGLMVTDPDCFKQTVFQKLYDSEGTLIAAHEDIHDSAQTVGDEAAAKKKKKKKDGKNPGDPVSDPTTPAKSKPKGVPVGLPGGTGGPRQIINSVPSGETGGYGTDLFAR